MALCHQPKESQRGNLKLLQNFLKKWWKTPRMKPTLKQLQKKLLLSKRGSLSPPKRRSKKAKISPELPKKEVEETNIQAPSVVETAGSVSPPKRKSKGKKIKPQDSSEESAIGAPTKEMDEIKKLATIVLEMPGTVPQMILKETVFKPKQDTSTEEGVVVTDEEGPQKELTATVQDLVQNETLSKKADIKMQTMIENIHPVSTKAPVEFVSSGEMEEKKMAIIVLDIPESVDQPKVSVKPDTIKPMDANDKVETEVAKVTKDLQEVPEDVSIQQQERQMPIEVDTALNKVTISGLVERMDVSLPIDETEEKKVAIVVLEMPQELPKTESKSVDKDSEDQQIKEQTTEIYTKPAENVSTEEPSKMTKQIVIEPMTADVDALPETADSKVATIILEIPDSAVSKMVPEDGKPTQDQKDKSTTNLGGIIPQISSIPEEESLAKETELKTQDLVAVVEPQFETKPELASTDDIAASVQKDEETMDISTTPPDLAEKEDIKITPLLEKSTAEAEPMQDKDTITMPVSEGMDLSEPTTRQDTDLIDTKEDIMKPLPSRDQEQDRKDVVDDFSKPMQDPMTATQEEPVTQEAEILTIIQETGPDVDDTKVKYARTIQEKFDSFEEVDLQPKSTLDVSGSIVDEEKPELVSDKQQDSNDMMEEVSKPEQVTQTDSEDVERPKEVETRQNGFSSVSEIVVLGDADSTHVTLEKSEIILQPGQNAKEVSQVMEGIEVIQEVKPKQTDAPQILEVVSPQKAVVETTVETKDIPELPKTIQVDEIAMQPDQDAQKVPTLCIAEPQITTETVKIEVSDSNTQPIEEAVVAEETIVEYISIIREPIVQQSEEDKMAAKKSDIAPEVSSSSSILQTEALEMIKIELTASTLSPQIEEIARPSEVPPQNVSTKSTAENAVSTSLADYINHICKEPLDIEKRYTLLDVHDSEITQVCTLDTEKADEAGPNESSQPISATVLSTDAPHVVDEMHVDLHVDENMSSDQDKPIDSKYK
ncbi:hypothetical protein NQD34_016650 [Periophthalmus magnuspinnatus]|nr:hypothetical protein NQD34_016650 [Periophthalmus magnuspinnatus]